MNLQKLQKRFHVRKPDLPEKIVWKTKLANTTEVKRVIKDPFQHFKWSKDAAVTSSIGKVFEFEKNSLVNVKNVSNSLARQFAITRSESLLYRKSTHQLINMIDTNDPRLIVLDGESGIGKSATMLNIALQYHQSNTLILYIPNLSSWTSGKYEYEGTPNGYLQPTLCRHILSDLVAWNEKILKSLPSPVENQNLLQFCQSGISNLKISNEVLLQVLDQILSEKCEDQVLIALDQVNALYSSTVYRDKESTPLTADKFILIAKIHSILAREKFGNEKVVRIIAQDMTKPLVRSRPLERMIRELENISDSPQIDVSRNRYQQLENVSEFGVLLPSKLESQQSFAEIKLGNAVKLQINSFDKSETEKMLDFYHAKNIVSGEDVDRNTVEKNWMLSQGNPSELLKAASTFF